MRRRCRCAMAARWLMCVMRDGPTCVRYGTIKQTSMAHTASREPRPRAPAGAGAGAPRRDERRRRAVVDDPLVEGDDLARRASRGGERVRVHANRALRRRRRVGARAHRCELSHPERHRRERARLRRRRSAARRLPGGSASPGGARGGGGVADGGRRAAAAAARGECRRAWRGGDGMRPADISGTSIRRGPPRSTRISGRRACGSRCQPLSSPPPAAPPVAITSPRRTHLRPRLRPA